MIGAVKTNLEEQKLLQNAVKESLNLRRGTLNGSLLEMILYGAQGLFRPNQDDRKRFVFKNTVKVIKNKYHIVYASVASISRTNAALHLFFNEFI